MNSLQSTHIISSWTIGQLTVGYRHGQSEGFGVESI